ncbi:hypothetical protein [Caulobacter sp. RL271]|uniref:Uncharacterized protein n=1 Tax=Caulobacter segnis TaxID=88688 RepID=A0ABY4ZXL0_9CAUL|nr:hypothetical protein [Caulobacter segnis]USQ97240.1 hypothetical protein MZV50_06775 [Caulobacter segnis]
MIYARDFDGIAVTATAAAWSRFDAETKKLFKPVTDEVRDGWIKVNGVWTAPPDQPVPAPTEYYLAKVTFERRFSDPAFALLDGLRITARNRPADWPTNEDPTWVALRPYVRALADYDAADRINVLDPAVAALLRGLQQDRQVFGDDPVAAETIISAILTPAQLPGEPTP